MSVPASVTSTGTMQSVPDGIGAPVMMRTAHPGLKAMSAREPAGTSSMTVKVTGEASLAEDTSPTMTA